MTPRERVINRLNKNKIDKIPNLNIVMQFSAKQSDVMYGEYCSDYKKLVQCDIKCAQDFGIDLLSVISDPMREASGFGAQVIIHKDDVPGSRGHVIKKLNDIGRLKPIKPESDMRMLDRIKAVELFIKEAGDEYPVCGWVEGAVAEAADLRDINELMMDLLTEPEAVHELLEICTQQGIAFAKAQIDAGADIIGVGDAAASLIGPDLYKQFGQPYEKKLLSKIKEMGAYTKLHICGNIEPVLELLPKEYCDIVDVDWMVDFKKANDILGDSCCLSGNYDPVEILLQGNDKTIEQAVIDCIDMGNDGYFCSAGYEVPKNTPPENLIKVDSVLKEYRFK